MKILIILLTVCGLYTTLPNQKSVTIRFRVTNKAQFASDPKRQEKDPFIEKAMNEMMKQTRIVSEFQLTSNEIETTISKFELISKFGVARGPFYIKNGQWFGSNLLDSVPEFSVNYRETSEKKNILGYSCTKYLCQSKNSDSIKLEIWATPKLPAHVNPVIGLTNFPYGILEACFADSVEVIEAKSFNMLDNKKAVKIEEI